MRGYIETTMSRFVNELANPELVVRFQRLCGVEFVAEEEVGAGRLNQQQSVADDPHRHGDQATRLKWGTGDARLRHARPETVGNTNNNNNNDKSDGDGECGDGSVVGGGTKNGYVQNHHHLPVSNGVRTTNHPTTTQAFNSNNVNNNNNRSSASILDDQPTLGADFLATKESYPPCPKQESSNGSVIKTSRSQAKQEEINQAARRHLEKSVPRVCIRYRILYYWAKVGAFLGNEEFYLTGMSHIVCFSVGSWCCSSAFCGLLVVFSVLFLRLHLSFLLVDHLLPNLLFPTHILLCFFFFSFLFNPLVFYSVFLPFCLTSKPRESAK